MYIAWGLTDKSRTNLGMCVMKEGRGWGGCWAVWGLGREFTRVITLFEYI